MACESCNSILSWKAEKVRKKHLRNNGKVFMNWASNVASRCCLIHITIIILRHILCLVYLCPCLGLGVFMSYLCGLFFKFSLIFTIINHISTFKQRYLLFEHFLECLLLFLDDKVDEESKEFSNSKGSASACCLAFAWFFAKFSLALLIKVSLIKKACILLIFSNHAKLRIPMT